MCVCRAGGVVGGGGGDELGLNKVKVEYMNYKIGNICNYSRI